MKTFKGYLKENPRRFDPRDRFRIPVSRVIQPSKQIGGDKMVDFEDPAYSHAFNKSVKDSERWPPKPEADYKARQRRWAVSDGKKAEHLADS